MGGCPPLFILSFARTQKQAHLCQSRTKGPSRTARQSSRRRPGRAARRGEPHPHAALRGSRTRCATRPGSGCGPRAGKKVWAEIVCVCVCVCDRARAVGKNRNALSSLALWTAGSALFPLEEETHRRRSNTPSPPQCHSAACVQRRNIPSFTS